MGWQLVCRLPINGGNGSLVFILFRRVRRFARAREEARSGD